jgi:SAM-dependent methyltransferase
VTVVGTIENTAAAWSERADARTSWQAAGWSEVGQTQRFLAVLRHLDVRCGGTVLDYGCGTGRLSAFLPRAADYIGYDTAPGMLDRARRDHPDELFLDVLPEELFDHVVCVGCFNLPGSVEETFDRVAELWHETVRRSLVVSLYRGDDPRCLRYEPATLALWAKVLGCRRFVVDASSLDNDVILGMWR